MTTETYIAMARLADGRIIYSDQNGKPYVSDSKPIIMPSLRAIDDNELVELLKTEGTTQLSPPNFFEHASHTLQ